MKSTERLKMKKGRKRRKRKVIYNTIAKLTEIFEAAKQGNALLTEVAEQINEQISYDVWQELTDATAFIVSTNDRYFTDIRVALADYLISFNDIEGENWNDEDINYSVNGHIIDDGIIAYKMTTGYTGATYEVTTLDDVLAADTWFEETWSDKPPGFRSGASRQEEEVKKRIKKNTVT
jgi:hypothetical protein